VLDQEIRDTWTKIIEPSSFLQDGETSVGEAIKARGWPAVKDLKGQAMFFLNIYSQKKHLQKEGSFPGSCLFPRSSGVDEAIDKDYIYTESGTSEVMHARHGFHREYMHEDALEQFEQYASNGSVLLSADNPAAFGYPSVFLRSEMALAKSEFAKTRSGSAVIDMPPASQLNATSAVLGNIPSPADDLTTSDVGEESDVVPRT